MFDVAFAIELLPTMFKYVRVTLALSLSAMVVGLGLAFIISLIIDAKIPTLKNFLVYVSFFETFTCNYFTLFWICSNIENYV